MYIICGGNSNTDSEGSAAEKRSFKLQNHAKRKDTRPEFGPINNPQMMNKSDDGVLNRDRHADPANLTDEGKTLSHQTHHKPEAVRKPTELDNVADVNAGPFQRGIDVPFYWHVPRSGGGTINDILGR
jgi:hypothetical protein